MKRETFRHPKLLDLASRLNCSRPEAIGYLQLLWDFTAEYAIQGDIGKHADGAIARACDYSGDPTDFINTLIESRWLDRNPKYRLLVHDWAEHCERWVKLKIQKLGKSFIEPTIELTIEAITEAATEPSTPCDQSNPIQSNPIPPDLPDKSGGRPRDEHWEAMLAGCGLTDTTPTKSERGAWNKALKEIRETGADPPEIRRRCEAYKRNWPKVSLTPTALARRWNECTIEVTHAKTQQPRDTRTALQRFEDDLAAGKLG